MSRVHLKDGVEVPFSAAEETARDAEEASQVTPRAEAQAKAAQEALKRSGIDYNGKMLSATGADQAGLTAVAMAVVLARGNGQIVTPVNFEFENGQKLLINDGNFDAIYTIWAPFRQSFYA